MLRIALLRSSCRDRKHRAFLLCTACKMSMNFFLDIALQNIRHNGQVCLAKLILGRICQLDMEYTWKNQQRSMNRFCMGCRMTARAHSGMCPLHTADKTVGPHRPGTCQQDRLNMMQLLWHHPYHYRTYRARSHYKMSGQFRSGTGRSDTSHSSRCRARLGTGLAGTQCTIFRQS